MNLQLPNAPSSSATLRNLDEHNALLRRMRVEGSAIGSSRGVKRRSFLSDLPGFDIIAQLGQDHIMHDELEGTCMHKRCTA